MAGVPQGLAGTRHLISETERAGSQKTVVNCPQAVAADPKEILDDAVHRREALQIGGRLEPAPSGALAAASVDTRPPRDCFRTAGYCVTDGIICGTEGPLCEGNRAELESAPTPPVKHFWLGPHEHRAVVRTFRPGLPGRRTTLDRLRRASPCRPISGGGSGA